MGEDRASFLHTVRGNVRRNGGWVVQAELPRADGPAREPLYYTVGLTVSRLPELTLASNVAPSVARAILDPLARRAREGDLVVDSWFDLSGFNRVLSVRVEEDGDVEQLVIARELYGDRVRRWSVRCMTGGLWTPAAGRGRRR